MKKSAETKRSDVEGLSVYDTICPEDCTQPIEI